MNSITHRLKAAWSSLRGVSPGTLSHGNWGGGGPMHSDGFRTRRAPSNTELVNAFKGLAFACSRLNANGVARVPIRQYVTTTPGQAKPRSVPTRAVPRHVRRYLESLPGTGKRFAGSTDIVVEEVMESPILDRLNNPTTNPDSPFKGRKSLLYFTQLGMEVVGSSFWRYSLDDLGMPAELMPLPPAHVTPQLFATVQADGRIIDHYRGPVGEILPANRMLWFRNLSLANPYGASYSPTEACFQELGILDKHAASAEATFETFHPSGIVSPSNPDRPISPEAADRLEKSINKKATRGNRNKLVVEATAALNFSAWLAEQIDPNGVELSRSQKMVVANAFDVPLTMLETTDSNKASAGEGNKAHLINAISPRCELLAEQLTGWIHHLSRTDPMQGVHGPLGWDRTFLAFDNPVPEDEINRGKTLVSFVREDILRKDEARAEIGYEPHADGKGMEAAAKPKPGDNQADDDEKTPKGKSKATDDEDDE